MSEHFHSITRLLQWHLGTTTACIPFIYDPNINLGTDTRSIYYNLVSAVAVCVRGQCILNLLQPVSHSFMIQISILEHRPTVQTPGVFTPGSQNSIPVTHRILWRGDPCRPTSSTMLVGLSIDMAGEGGFINHLFNASYTSSVFEGLNGLSKS
jgi:hypothetical protein